MSKSQDDRIVQAVEELTDELVEFTRELIQIPTINPPGEEYAACAELIGARLREFGFETETITAAQRPEHSDRYPRTNVIGLRSGSSDRPLVHINGHFDVVPVGEGWTHDPFGADIVDGKMYGRGTADMKAGLACGMFAAEALRRADVPLNGSIEISGTVDEESGGFAGVAHLAEIGRLTSERVDYAIIPEPFDPSRICVGHRGVYWFKVIAHGRIGHGSMPFLGVSAIEQSAALIEALRTTLEPALAARKTAMPVVPVEARHPTLNVNSILGGQGDQEVQTPCVADRCEAIFDRRFLIEEGFEATRDEVVELVDRVARQQPAWHFEIEDLMIVHPTQTPDPSRLVEVLSTRIGHVLGEPAAIVASPGTYDHKHFARLGGIEHCVAYGPGVLEQAHQPDEWCAIDDMVDATSVMALTLADLIA